MYNVGSLNLSYFRERISLGSCSIYVQESSLNLSYFIIFLKVNLVKDTFVLSKSNLW